MSVAPLVRTPQSLYRFLVRQTALLPQEAQQYYRHRIKQEFRSHADESDPERVRQIMDGAVRDMKWLVSKYSAGDVKQM